MKKILIILGICFLTLLGLTSWLIAKDPKPVSLDSFLDDRLPILIDPLKTEATRTELTSLFFEGRPAELSQVDRFLPHYQDYDYAEIKSLYEFSSNCLKPKKIKESAELVKAWQWIRFKCQNTPLAKNFFKQPPYLFPSGKSFVQLADESNFNFEGYLNPIEIINFKSVGEIILKSALGSEVNLQQIKGFLASEDILIGTNSVFFKDNSHSEVERQKIYFKIDKLKWNELFKSEEYKFEDTFSKSCLLRMSSGCWVVNKNNSAFQKRYLRWIIYSLDGLLILSLLAFIFVDRKRRIRQKDNQRFVLQMLTHELRTPVTTLSLILENIRSNFDELTSPQQVQFLKMGKEISRLKNSMQMSYAYLQTDSLKKGKIKVQFENIDLNSFILNYIESQEYGTINYTPPTEQLSVHAERFWLELCLNNIVSNSFDHGKPPVQLTIKGTTDFVAIVVQDAGSITQTDLVQLTQPFNKGVASKGLGLGLSIISQIMREMNGRLEIDRSPTRFSIFLRRLT